MDTSYEMEPFLVQNEAPHHEGEEEDEYSIIAAAEIKESLPPPSSSSSTPQSSCFTTLTDSDIRKLQTTEINKVSSVLLIPQSDACLLLIHHGWSAMKVHGAWFEDEQRVRELVGLLNSNNNINHSKELIQSSTCEICFDDSVWYKKVEYAKCGHGYCIDCWKQYIDEKIQEGPHECLKPMRCPHPSCEASLEIDTIRRFASETNKNMYDHFLLRSYVETRKNIKWCPSPGCDLAVLYESDGNYANKYVEACCSNEHRFCWECGEDGHRPVSCETVAEWMKKNLDDSQSVIWISAFTKECPDCGIRIEKSEGCMQMICTVCGCRFCWLCLSKWSLCSAYGCNRFSARNNTETPTMNNGNGYLDLERYTHYYERWFTNEFSRKKSIEVMEKYLNDENIRILCKEFDERREDDFEFLKKAWEEVIECRNLLKWTYAYGYFIPEDEKAKKELFEHTQGVAESALEKLHKFAETMLMEILNKKKDGFDRNSLELSHLTIVTKNFFDNMVTQLEDRGLDDVNVKSYGESSTSSSLSPRGVVRDGMTEIGLRKCGYCGYYNLASTLECPCIEKKYQCWTCPRDPRVIWCPLRIVN